MINVYNAEEVSLIRESCRLVAKTLIVLESYIKPGVNTLFLDKIAEDFIRSHGAIPAFKGYGGPRNPYPATLCVSVNEEVVHGIPGNRELKDGDIVGIDCGNVLNGFYGDHAKTFAVGEVPADTMDLIRHTRLSLELGLAKAKAGNRVNDIGNTIQTYIEDKGYSVVRDLVGHGVGRQLHEEPAVPNFGKSGSGPLLKPGMVLAIEPMINRGGWRVKVQRDGWTIVTADKSMSAHFEHTVLVGEQSAEILTTI